MSLSESDQRQVLEVALLLIKAMVEVAPVLVEQHLGGKHNQKTHGGRYGSPEAIAASRKRLKGDKEALGRFNQRVKQRQGKGGGGSNGTGKKTGGSKLDKAFSDAPKDKAAFTNHLMGKVQSGELSFSEAQELNSRYLNEFGGASKSGKGKADGFRQFDKGDFGRGEDVKQWSSWEKGLSDKQKTSLKAYQSEPGEGFKTDYVTINDSLRKGTKADAATRSAIRDIDASMGNVPEDTTVFRSVSSDTFKSLDVGSTIEDKGFVSTSLSKDVAKDFGRTTFEIKVPKGSKGAYLDALGKREGGSAERELLLPRGSKFKVTNISKQGNRTDITAELVQ